MTVLLDTALTSLRPARGSSQIRISRPSVSASYNLSTTGVLSLPGSPTAAPSSMSIPTATATATEVDTPPWHPPLTALLSANPHFRLPSPTAPHLFTTASALSALYNGSYTGPATVHGGAVLLDLPPSLAGAYYRIARYELGAIRLAVVYTPLNTQPAAGAGAGTGGGGGGGGVKRAEYDTTTLAGVEQAGQAVAQGLVVAPAEWGEVGAWVTQCRWSGARKVDFGVFETRRQREVQALWGVLSKIIEVLTSAGENGTWSQVQVAEGRCLVHEDEHGGGGGKAELVAGREVLEMLRSPVERGAEKREKLWRPTIVETGGIMRAFLAATAAGSSSPTTTTTSAPRRQKISSDSGNSTISSRDRESPTTKPNEGRPYVKLPCAPSPSPTQLCVRNTTLKEDITGLSDGYAGVTTAAIGGNTARAGFYTSSTRSPHARPVPTPQDEPTSKLGKKHRKKPLHSDNTNTSHSPPGPSSTGGARGWGEPSSKPSKTPTSNAQKIPKSAQKKTTTTETANNGWDDGWVDDDDWGISP